MSRQPDFVARVIEIIESRQPSAEPAFLTAVEQAIRTEYGGDKPYVAKISPERDTQIIHDLRNGHDLANVCRQHRVSRRKVELLRVKVKRQCEKVG